MLLYLFDVLSLGVLGLRFLLLVGAVLHVACGGFG